MVVSIWRTYPRLGNGRRDGNGDRLRCVARGERHPVGSRKVGTGKAEMGTRFGEGWRRPHA